MSEEDKKQAAPAEEVAQQAPAKEAPKGEAAPEAKEGEEPKSSQPTAQDLLTEGLGDVKIRKAKGSKNIHSGVCHILATFNNTKVTFSDASGNVISWSS